MRHPRIMPTLMSIVILAVLAIAAPIHAAGDTIFAGAQVHTVNIEFSQPAFWDSLTAYYDAGLEQYMAATVTFDGTVLDSVGVRLKGNSSYSHPNDKKPFRLAFDEYIGSQRLDGLKNVQLSNCWEDPTFLREKLHWDALREAGVPAPRANFADVYLNGELWGLYSLVEHVDKTFLSARFGNKEGNLYKAVDGIGTAPRSDFRWLGADTSLYTDHYELKTEESLTRWTDLVTVIDSLNHGGDLATALPAVVDMPSLYAGLAIDHLLSNMDSYAVTARNFYLYFDQVTGKMRWIPWDASLTMGSYWYDVKNYETLPLTYVSSAVNRPLAADVFAVPELRNAYLRTACFLARDVLTVERLDAEIDALAALVRPHVAADPRKMYTLEQFDANLVSDIDVDGHRKPGLKSYIALRAANVAAQLAAAGIDCEHVALPGDVVINEFAADNTQVLDPAGEAADWVELFNATAQDVDLGGWRLSDSAAAPAKWRFPAGTVIPARGYLMVWADNDTLQEGLHASWKLSAGGEQVVLSDASGALMDSLTFGPQVVDLTSARIPN
ncbi:MAG TPA: CotH kinase family protein, partial [Candidatus Krumholzibacteria bacterium]|nr:CotH kinase family protein [Candidatus Krumholzibacteria bacterium]